MFAQKPVLDSAVCGMKRAETAIDSKDLPGHPIVLRLQEPDEQRGDVLRFEAEGYVGGHAHTVDVKVGRETYAADTGFMVFNDRTYPKFIRMLDLLGVPSRNQLRSMNASCTVVVRCRFQANASKLMTEGADSVVSEEAEAATALRRILSDLGD